MIYYNHKARAKEHNMKRRTYENTQRTKEILAQMQGKKIEKKPSWVRIVEKVKWEEKHHGESAWLLF